MGNNTGGSSSAADQLDQMKGTANNQAASGMNTAGSQLSQLGGLGNTGWTPSAPTPNNSNSSSALQQQQKLQDTAQFPSMNPAANKIAQPQMGLGGTALAPQQDHYQQQQQKFMAKQQALQLAQQQKQQWLQDRYDANMKKRQLRGF
jgi:hypothetical protein